MGGAWGSEPQPRPPSRAEIGRASWRYVHALAAEYPEAPTQEDREGSLSWMRSFLRLYPCGLCSKEFMEVCGDLPPRFDSRADYTLWWCEAHNRVREDLSQPLHRCEVGDLLSAGRSGLFVRELPGTDKSRAEATGMPVDPPKPARADAPGAAGKTPAADCAACRDR